ncbi:MAG: hypothetical protein KIT09_31000 [Bryobacteraceae bacterium]|nr:hypothetical protein [Bryobacteraceae bacterium]
MLSYLALLVGVPPALAQRDAPKGKDRPSRAEKEAPEGVWSEVIVGPEGKVEQVLVEPPGWDSLLRDVRNQVGEFTDDLPNYVCEQVTDRYVSNDREARWKRQDRITADVLYLDGKESYHNFRRNGKPAKAPPEATGTWSYGEFGTVMADLFAISTNAAFDEAPQETIRGIPTRVYNFSVPQESSHWKVQFERQVLYPAFNGSVWLDPKNQRAVRIEINAEKIPDSYPADKVEMAVDYGMVEIAGEEYLFPIGARNLFCKRYSARCTRNEIQFRDCRKFTAESVVSTTESKITFEREQEKPEKKK